MKHQDFMDEMIERTLVRDSQKVPAFPTTPNSALTAKLAISVASKGMLSAIGAKLALFGGAALLAGGVLYYASSQHSTPSLQPVQPSNPQVAPIASDTAKRDTVKSQQAKASTAKATVHTKIKTAHVEPAQPKPAAAIAKDTTPIPHIQNPNYQPPLK